MNFLEMIPATPSLWLSRGQLGLINKARPIQKEQAMHAKIASKRLAALSAGLVLVAGVTAAASSAAVVPINFNKADKFAVTTTGGITNVGQSTINGNLGLTSVITYSDTGLLTLKGEYHFGDANAVNAAADVASAYNQALAETPTVVIAPELGGVTLTPGIYSSATGFTLNGTLTLDAQNNRNAQFIFLTPLAITTGANSKVNVINGLQACNVTWQVGTTSTLGAGSDFKGNLLGKGNFTSAAGSMVAGRVLISGGSVALNATQITVPNCKKYDDDSNKPKNLANGGGAYRSNVGRANFNVQVSGTSLNGVYSNIGGHITWNVSHTWKFMGDVNTYAVDAQGVTTVTGNGSLYYFLPKNNKGEDGRWVNATTGGASFTSKFARDLKSDGTLGKIKTFAIGFTGTPVNGAPVLPVLGTLLPVTGGGED